MTETKIKSIVGILIVCAQFIVLGLILILYFMGGFLFDEMTTSIALILPMFSLYTTSIIKHFYDNRFNKEEGENLNSTYIFMTLFIPSVFIVALVATIMLKAFNMGFSSFEQFKTTLTIIQAGFGAYFGLVLTSLFDIDVKRKTR